MSIKEIVKAFVLLGRGEWRRVYNEVHVRIYQWIYTLVFWIKSPFLRLHRSDPPAGLRVETRHPVAFESPDHIVPTGTALNNSTNRKFILHMDELLRREFGNGALRCLDLGCSGGQMVQDFLRLKWLGLGLEGSDYSLKTRRANWRTLANRNLFTCNITKPFRVTLNQNRLKFHLITAWEVLEHIAAPELPGLFQNIVEHLEDGGYFIASTNSLPDIHDGVDLHQTKWSNAEWRVFVEREFVDLEPTDVGLKIYQYVRFSFLQPSFLIYRKKIRQGASSAILP